MYSIALALLLVDDPTITLPPEGTCDTIEHGAVVRCNKVYIPTMAQVLAQYGNVSVEHPESCFGTMTLYWRVSEGLDRAFDDLVRELLTSPMMRRYRGRWSVLSDEKRTRYTIGCQSQADMDSAALNRLTRFSDGVSLGELASAFNAHVEDGPKFRIQGYACSYRFGGTFALEDWTSLWDTVRLNPELKVVSRSAETIVIRLAHDSPWSANKDCAID